MRLKGEVVAPEKKGCMGESRECMVEWMRCRGDTRLFSACNSKVREKLMELRELLGED